MRTDENEGEFSKKMTSCIIYFYHDACSVRDNTGFDLGFDHWGDNLSPWLKFWGTFSFLGGQKFVHPSADAKGFVVLAGLLIGLGRKSQISRDF